MAAYVKYLNIVEDIDNAILFIEHVWWCWEESEFVNWRYYET